MELEKSHCGIVAKRFASKYHANPKDQSIAHTCSALHMQTKLQKCILQQPQSLNVDPCMNDSMKILSIRSFGTILHARTQSWIIKFLSRRSYWDKNMQSSIQGTLNMDASCRVWCIEPLSCSHKVSESVRGGVCTLSRYHGLCDGSPCGKFNRLGTGIALCMYHHTSYDCFQLYWLGRKLRRVGDGNNCCGCISIDTKPWLLHTLLCTLMSLRKCSSFIPALHNHPVF